MKKRRKQPSEGKKEAMKHKRLKKNIAVGAAAVLAVLWLAMMITSFAAVHYDRENYQLARPLFTFSDSRAYDEEIGQWDMRFGGAGFAIRVKSEPGWYAQYPAEKSLYVLGLHIITYRKNIDIADGTLTGHSELDWF